MAVPDAVLLLLVRTCAIVVPEPVLPPLIVAVCTTVQPNVVPLTVPLKAIEGA